MLRSFQFLPLASVTIQLAASSSAFAQNYPEHSWTTVPDANKPDWEVLPQSAKPREVILPKETSLAFSPTLQPGNGPDVRLFRNPKPIVPE
jgi:hypothetical protein